MIRDSGMDYITADGETWDEAALAVYGDERFAADLMTYNPEKTGKLTFLANERLRLPMVRDTDIHNDDPSYAPETAPWRL